VTLGSTNLLDIEMLTSKSEKSRTSLVSPKPTRVYQVLVFPGGTEIGLEIQKSLFQCKDINLYSAGLDISNHAPYIFGKHFMIPSIHDPNWINSLNQIILEYQIDYIFPAYDDIIVALTQSSSHINAQIVSSPLETCLITRSKSHTYRLLEGILPVPRLYEKPDLIKKYPVFVKPDRGQGSENTKIINSRNQLTQILRECNNLIITEYLSGEEYTIDCFSDRDAGLLFCSGRQRIRTKNGITMHSRLINNPLFLDYAQKITEKLVMYGAWFFQLKKDEHNVYKVLEIAPRIAGTMAINRVIGVNFPLLSLYEQERLPIEIMTNPIEIEIDRALVNRYKHKFTYKNVYIDLDETLIINGLINTFLVRFIYQCINNKIKVILLTKHAGNLTQTLHRYRILELFDEIIHLSKIQEKADFINKEDSIFIDDSFSERRAVYKRLGILTFDCSMLELLLDDRCD
jgi:carbamoyl-phosphate synthase large subunit